MFPLRRDLTVTPEPNRLYSGTHALSCAETFLAKQGPSRPYVYWTALAICTVALASLPMIQVDVSVQERGRVRPAAERSAIVARTAGFIASVHVRDNDLVRAGDTLLTLNARALQAKLDLNGSQTELVEKELTDLSYLLEGLSNKRPVSLGDLQTARYISEYQKFDTACRHADLNVDRSEREMNRTRQLFADKVVAARDLEQSAYEANAARVEREVIYRQTIAQWQADKVQKQGELEQREAEARQLAEERNLYAVKAPVEGTVIGLEGVFEGSYVQSGQRIGDISPTSDFVIDVSVPPKDIGRIAKGQPVSIQVDAYPYTVWGLLPGRVIRISADYVQQSDTSSTFKVVVRPDRDHVETREGLSGLLKKGMTVNARFLVARRSLWELLYESIDKSFNPAMNEEGLVRDRAQ
jgi:membrane fusion protein, peptide pheromone/bacteriocin exporter